jgi:hypothetical protein
MEGEIILQGEKSSVSLRYSQQCWVLTDGIMVVAENTNKLTELTASANNNTADFFININRRFFWLDENKSKKLPA